MPGIHFQTIRDLVPIARVLLEIGWREKTRKGGEARGVCPVHGSTSRYVSRSFAVNLNTDRWYCHRCRKGGDVIDLLAFVRGLTVYEAALQLCDVFKIGVPWMTAEQPYKKGTGLRNGTGHAPSPSSMA